MFQNIDEEEEECGSEKKEKHGIYDHAAATK